MRIRREDLLAAAAAGVVQYRQIDAILIFLLQREARQRRLRGTGGVTVQRGAWRWPQVVAAFLLPLAATFAGWQGAALLANLSGPLLLGLSASYLLATLALALGLEVRNARFGLRLAAILALMLLPLAMLAAQRLGSG